MKEYIEVLSKKKLKRNLYIKTNAWSKDRRYVYLYITKVLIKDDIYNKFYCILPKQSIIVLLNNYIDSFKWEFFMKCLHRYGKDDKLSKEMDFIQRFSLVKNLKTKKHKRGKPKKRSRPILVDFNNELHKMINGNNKWLIVSKKEYNYFCLLYKINNYIHFIHKNEYNIPNEIFKYIYKYII